MTEIVGSVRASWVARNHGRLCADPAWEGLEETAHPWCSLHLTSLLQPKALEGAFRTICSFVHPAPHQSLVKSTNTGRCYWRQSCLCSCPQCRGPWGRQTAQRQDRRSTSTSQPNLQLGWGLGPGSIQRQTARCPPSSSQANTLSGVSLLTKWGLLFLWREEKQKSIRCWLLPAWVQPRAPSISTFL